MTDAATLEGYNIRARAWFDSLRDRIVATFETLEDSGEPRVQGLGSMFATALQTQIKPGELGRTLAKNRHSA